MHLDRSVIASGRVLQVNVSGGGIPKRPVERAWVNALGLESDEHREYTVHGGPHQAVCLFGIEAIERLQSEGHPVEPGSVGENLTTTGIEWSLLPVGSRARIGVDLELEVASPATPCKTQTRNFTDGRFSRMAIDQHPSDSRMYARVLREGEVRPGDPIAILPPTPDSRAAEEIVLYRLDRVSGKADAALWNAAARSGFDIDVIEDGDIVMASARDISGPAFNHAMGFARYPNLIGMATDFYDERRRPGWLWTADAPSWATEPEITVNVFHAKPTDIPEATGPKGLTVRTIGTADANQFVGVYAEPTASSGLGDKGPDPWPAVYDQLANWPHRWLFLAELDGKPVGSASLHTHGKAAWLRGGVVALEQRGQGIQRALIAARARKAVELGCEIVGSMADPDGPSSTNLQRMGLRPIGVRRLYAYPPAGI